MSRTNVSPSKSKTNLTTLLNGLQTSLPADVSQVILAGKARDVADVIQQLRGYVALQQAVDAANQQRARALTARDAADPEKSVLIEQLTIALRGLFGSSDPILANFGVSPKGKRKPLTSEALVVRAQKSQATREARGTMGKRQKQAIHGVVPPAPVESPAPSLATKPVPPATSGGAAPAPANGVTQTLQEGGHAAS